MEAYRAPAGERRLVKDQIPSLPMVDAPWLCRPPEAGEGHKKVRGIRACFINATSLKKHIGHFRQYDTSCNLFGVAESRLGDLVDDHLVKIMGYSIIRQDRNTAVGDVLMYVRNDLKAKILIKAKTT